jgi:hypothetical protein
MTIPPPFSGTDPPDVLVLGAGFSRAVSSAMPITDGLGNLVIERVGLVGDRRLPSDGFKDGTFENWLSRLAEDQPQLSDVANQENRLLYTKLAEAIGAALVEMELSVFETDAPRWLYELLSVLHYRQATVITFNYDTIVEIGVDTHLLWAGGTGRRINERDILEDLPPTGSTTPTYDGVQPEIADTFRLLKLHGSSNWYWMSGDPTGTTLQRRVLGSQFGSPATDDPARRRRELQGREPFIVPPTATKSAYYRNPTSRVLWSSAASALAVAARIALVGYSIPLTDIATSGMIADAIRGRTVSIEVVNPEPEGPVGRLRRMGVREEDVNVIDGDNCLATFTAAYRDRTALEFVSSLQAFDAALGTDVALVLAWGDPRFATPVPAYRVLGFGDPTPAGDVEVILDPPKPLSSATGPRFDASGQPSGEVLPCLADLARRAHGVRRFIATPPGSTPTVIIGAWYHRQKIGASAAWMVLTPAGKPYVP